MNKNSERSSFSRSLLSWFEKEKRPLPFRKSKDPYKVWLSEIILQQTQMETGINYYKKFIERFPKVDDLATAKQEEVYSLWQGLGYYNRAKNLHKTARIVSKNKGGFPKIYEDLIKLPGIGKYTASAISSICYNEKNYVVDANVYRVLSRVFGIKTNINKPRAYNDFHKLTSSLAKNIKNTGDYNEALMDFGGSVCLPKKPKCKNCVFKKECFAYKNNMTESIPLKKQNKKIKIRFFNYYVFENKDVILVKKRSQKDIWENLFEFYLIENKNSKKATEHVNKTTKMNLPPPSKEKAFSLLSHQKINVIFYGYTIQKKEDIIALQNTFGMKMLTKSKIKNLGFPKVIDNYLKSHC